MLPYKPIQAFKIGDVISQLFLIANTNTRVAKNNKVYSVLTLKDKSGSLDVKIWDFDVNQYVDIASGSFIRLEIEIQDYKGQRSAVAKGAPMSMPSPTDLNPYESDLRLTAKQADECFASLMIFKNQVENIFIKTYLDVIFDDPATQELFKTAPASVSNRGAYFGGLSEHTLKVMLNAQGIIQAQLSAKDPVKIDRDIIIAGVLCHDLGKMYAYKVSPTGVHHTRSGLLLAHLPMSYGLSVQAFIRAEGVLRREIPEAIKDHINHCILAHHGTLEWGSPVKPQSVEARIVHVADMADGTTSCFAELARDNIDQVDENGFVPGSFFATKTVYVGNKGKDE